jgi:undecaprenyl-diphosphatase
MTLLQVLVLGLVQGITEFLPVSATAHLRIVPAIFGWHFYHGSTQNPGSTFTAVVRLGSMLALVGYFWRELLHVCVAWARGLYDRSMRGSLEYRMGWYLLLATIPVIVLRIVFSDRLDSGAENLWLLAGSLIVVALAIWAAEIIGGRRRVEELLDAADATAVGVAQVISLVPGASRVGTMFAAGLFRGLERPAAIRFAFLLSVPAVVADSIYEVVRMGGVAGARSAHSPGAGLIGFAVVVAFVSALVTIHWLVQWLTRHSTLVFVYYRLALGVLVIALIATGVLEATG